MPLPTTLTFNELDGEEVKAVLTDRCHQVLDQCPHFKRHLTFPRVRMTLEIRLETYADQPSPGVIPISDKVDVIIEGLPPAVFTGETVDTAAPVPGGHPPDEIRAIHGLPVSRPAPGDRATGSQAYTVDVLTPEPPVEPERRMAGLTVHSRHPEFPGFAGVAEIDQGPGGLARHPGQYERVDFSHFGKR